MPEGEKNDGFNGAKFENRIVGFQQLFGRIVEEEKPVESQRYREVVNHRDIKISRLRTGLVVMVEGKGDGEMEGGGERKTRFKVRFNLPQAKLN